MRAIESALPTPPPASGRLAKFVLVERAIRRATVVIRFSVKFLNFYERLGDSVETTRRRLLTGQIVLAGKRNNAFSRYGFEARTNHERAARITGSWSRATVSFNFPPLPGQSQPM